LVDCIHCTKDLDYQWALHNELEWLCTARLCKALHYELESLCATNGTAVLGTTQQYELHCTRSCTTNYTAVPMAVHYEWSCYDFSSK
jgi:hypothetical protein